MIMYFSPKEILSCSKGFSIVYGLYRRGYIRLNCTLVGDETTTSLVSQDTFSCVVSKCRGVDELKNLSVGVTCKSRSGFTFGHLRWTLIQNKSEVCNSF